MALKILLADDSMTAQNMGKKILVDAGYDVVAVSNGAAAIKKIASERPDMAILDEYMPGYTGSEVCERVKAAAETAKMPVLLTVGKMEPFDQEKANKVHADGVMIKPFEASDLIAAVQSIAQRLLAPAPPPRGLDSTVQLRQGHGASLDDTLRVPPPKPSDISHEDTMRLTAQQIKAFQDASYHDWAKTAEPHLEEHEKAAAAAEAAARQAVEEATPAMPVMTPEAPVAEAAGMIVEAPAGSRETPVFSAMAASGAAAEHEILNGSAPVARVEEPLHATAAPVFYTPPVIEETPQESVPAFAVESATPMVEPVTPVVELAPVAPVVAPVMEAEVAPPAPVLEPIVEAAPVAPVLEVAPHVPVAEAPPVLETSAPLTPGPMLVAPAAELEPTIAPPVEVASTPARELEITSPPQEHGAVIGQDPALVTESEDMSQFVTTFGVEGAEPVHVGMASDLSDEQLAAIMTPLEAPPAIHQPPTAEISVAPLSVTPTVHLAAPVSPIQEEIGTIEAVEPLEAVEPVVAYIPEMEDTLVPATREPEREPVPVAAPAIVVEPAPPAIEATQVIEAVAAVVPEPVAEVAPVEEPPAPVMAVAPEPAPPEPAIVSEEHASVIYAVETALAAAAGTAATVGIAHVIHAEPAVLEPPVVHEVVPHEAVVHEVVTQAPPEPQPVPAEEAHREPFGDAALAEELAAALSNKETEERAKAAVEAAAAAALQPAAAAMIAPVAGMASQTLSDDKLADAVARAFENLKPHLISEIIKELGK